MLGLSTSQVSGDKLGGFDKAGLLAGIFAKTKIYERIDLQMEITYIQKGSRNPNMNEDLIPHISLNYVEVPLILKYRQNNTLSFESGGQFALLINGFYSDIYGKINNTDINPFINYDISVLLGLNYTILKDMILNMRLSNSIFAIGKEDYSTNSYNSLNKGKYNSVLSFTIYYYIWKIINKK